MAASRFELQVLIDGNTLAEDALTACLQNEADALLGLTKQGEDLPAAELPRCRPGGIIPAGALTG